jgi:hypothetical protein
VGAIAVITYIISFFIFLKKKSPTKLNTSDIRNLSLGIEMKHFPSGRVFLSRAVSSFLGVIQYDETLVRTSSAIDFELSMNVDSSSYSLTSSVYSINELLFFIIT